MSHKRLWAAATIILFVILIGFVLSVPHTRDVGDVAQLENPITSVPSVTLHDSFKKGVHTITGSVEAPNACTTITAQTSPLGDAGSVSGILVALSLSKDSGVCLQIPTQVSFTVTIGAPAHLPMTATVNGVTATTTVS